MSTRGFIGFVADGHVKVAYNHSDSYPDYLGVRVLAWLKAVAANEGNLTSTRALVTALRPVPETDPTPEDIERCKPFMNLGVGQRSTSDWYCLLRETQGDPAAMLAAGLFEDAGDFPADSLFAEWGYVADFDNQVFEAYEGFQRSAHGKGRFASLRGDDATYHPVALAASWPFAELPDEKAFITALEGDDEDES